MATADYGNVSFKIIMQGKFKICYGINDSFDDNHISKKVSK